MKPPSILLFDLGGVMVENATFQELPRLLPQPMEPSVLFDRWLESDALRQFELGRTAPDVFAAAFVAEWKLQLEPHEFLAEFSSWPRGPYPGALEMLDSLRPDFVVGCLSNCNALHWERLDQVVRRFDHGFSSHKLGLGKPDIAIFRRVIDELACAPQDICFFDDSRKNVSAALATGMTAHHTVGFGALIDKMADLGLSAQLGKAAPGARA